MNIHKVHSFRKQTKVIYDKELETDQQEKKTSKVEVLGTIYAILNLL